MSTVEDMVRDSAREQLHRPFLGRRSRLIAWAAAIGQAVILLATVVALGDRLQWYDRVAFVVVAAGVGWLLTRFALVAAFPDEDGVTVRNLLLTRRLAWAEIVAVRFGGGQPWILLDLSDGETLAVMAVQRADGAHGEAEARRFATLLALHDRAAGSSS